MAIPLKIPKPKSPQNNFCQRFDKKHAGAIRRVFLIYSDLQFSTPPAKEDTMPAFVRLPLAILLLALLFASPVAQAANNLCTAGNDQLYAAGDSTATWTQEDLAKGRVSNACASLVGTGFGFYAALSGHMKAASADAVLKRFAAISSLAGMTYWSETDNRNETLVRKAVALDGPGGATRADFTLAEIRSGKELYFSQTDNRSARPVEYRMTASMQKSGKIVVSIINTSAVYWSVIPVFKPQALQSLYVLKPIGNGRYGYFSLSAVRSGLGIAGASQQKSTLNRARAMYAHFVTP